MSKFTHIWECIRRQKSAFTASDMADCAECSARHARRLLRLLAKQGLVVPVGRAPVAPGTRGKGAEMWVCADPDIEIAGAHRSRKDAEPTDIRWTGARRPQTLLSPDEVSDTVFALLEAGVSWVDICARTRLRSETLRGAMRERGLIGAPAGRLARLARETTGDQVNS